MRKVNEKSEQSRNLSITFIIMTSFHLTKRTLGLPGVGEGGGGGRGVLCERCGDVGFDSLRAA